MNKVLAAIDNSAAARPVLAAAIALAHLLDAEVEAVHAREDGDVTASAAAAAAGVPLRSKAAPVAYAVIEEGRSQDVAAVVVGARSTPVGRRPAGHIALELAVSLPKPLVVVPPDAAVPATFHRVLVPLNGDRTTAAALAGTLALACEHELEVIVLHVYDEASLPIFSDQPQHELEAWTDEFLRRNCPRPELVRLEVRVGIPGEHVLDVAGKTGADMIALGWAQALDAGHATVVRTALERSGVPVLLIPVGTREGSEAAAAAS